MYKNYSAKSATTPHNMGTDANGKLGNSNPDEEEEGNISKGQIGRKIIGPYTRTHQAEKGNGARLHRIRRRQQMIPTTTWEKPKIIKQDRWKQQPGDATRENWGGTGKNT